MWTLIRKYAKELLIIIVGIIVGSVLTKRHKESKIVEKTKKKIDEVGKMTEDERTLFKDKLESILKIKDDKQREQGLMNLWDYLKD